VVFTPPYHPELVLIETIWGVIKNRVAADPSRTMDELGRKLVTSCQGVTEKTWPGARRRVTAEEDKYWAAIDADLADDADNTDSVGELIAADASAADVMAQISG
jgi:hypothetical protein